MLVQILDYESTSSRRHKNDALSRISTHDSLVEKNNAKPVADFNVSIYDVEQKTGFKQISLRCIRKETEVDWDMQLLKQHIYDGFPNAKSCLPEQIYVYFDYRECLSVVDGIVMKGKCIVIPASLREKTLENLHRNCMGVSKTVERAKTVVFRPTMHKDLEFHLSKCQPYTTHKIKQKPQPLQHDVPKIPWHSLTMDNFEFCGSNYLIVYDWYPDFLVVKKAENLTARCTIQLLLEIFTEHGIPSCIRNGCSKNFMSSEFDAFCTDLNINLSYSSEYHHSSNQAERTVRTAIQLV